MPNSPLTTHHSPLTAWQRAILFLFFTVVVLFADLVEMRSAFLKRHMTDLQVYLRAAWSVRNAGDNSQKAADASLVMQSVAGQMSASGGPPLGSLAQTLAAAKVQESSQFGLYQIMDDNHWHYHYPPLLAILMMPLADAPVGVERTGLLPFGVSVSLWYKFNVLCLFLAVHWLASALEQTSPDPAVRSQPRGCQRWWALRFVPIIACFPPIGHTLMRGQVNLLLLAILCGMIAAALRGQRWRAGLWLAGAICLKVIPAFLLIYPLWRRDRRWLAGSVIGLVVGLAVIPAIVLGPRQTWAYGEEWTHVLLRPAFGAGEDQSRARELIEATATDSQSMQVALHNALHFNEVPRPAQPAPGVRIAHWFISALLTLITFVVAFRQRRDDGPALVMVIGALILVMVLTSPVCHIHYFCLALPLVMGILAAKWETSNTIALGSRTLLLLTGYVTASIILSLPGLTALRDLGLAGYANLILWGVGCVMLWRRKESREKMVGNLYDLPAAA